MKAQQILVMIIPVIITVYLFFKYLLDAYSVPGPLPMFSLNPQNGLVRKIVSLSQLGKLRQVKHLAT